MDWFIRLIKGVIISLGFILPGVSGGVLAAILGIYERILHFLAHITRDFVKNVLYFLPVGIGGILGLVLLSRPLEAVLDPARQVFDPAVTNWRTALLWGFAGAILGTLPSLLRESTSRSRRDSTDVLWLVGTVVVGGTVLYVLPAVGGTVPANFLGFVLAGAIIALGVLVPGLSPSNLLLILGLFSPMLQGFSDRDLLGTFLPIALGALAVLVLFSKFMERMIERHHSRAYHFIIGLVIASTILIVVPTQSAEAIDYTGVGLKTVLAAAGLFVVGLALGLWTARLESKYKTVEEPAP